MGKNAICDMSDEYATAHALGGRFEREDCGFFEQCSHRVEKYDMTVSPGGSVVEIWYCAIDWRKVGPLIALALLFFWYVYRKVHSAPHNAVKSGYSKYYKQ